MRKKVKVSTIRHKNKELEYYLKNHFLDNGLLKVSEIKLIVSVLYFHTLYKIEKLVERYIIISISLTIAMLIISIYTLIDIIKVLL